MTKVLTVVLGRLPIGWLQLIHNRTRLAAALAGVAFANILIFMQLGFLGALTESIKLPYELFEADVLISASDANTLSDGGNVPRQRMFQALATPGVASATPLYIQKLDWERGGDETVNLHVFGVDPRDFDFGPIGSDHARAQLELLDTALIDRKTRNIDKAVFAAIEAGRPLVFEANGRTIDVVDTFSVGAGFEADGYLIASDQTFLRLFKNRVSGAPSHILVTLEAGVDPAAVVARLRDVLPASDTIVRTVGDAAEADQTYQTHERPIGVVFGFGVIIGVLVGIIIVYQVLATDVADHLGEYATFKAMGYRQRFFLGIVFEGAMTLAILGFVPGMIIAMGLYEVVSLVTGLPVEMTPLRPVIVLAGTLAMCGISGAIATRRLAGADPADLF